MSFGTANMGRARVSVKESKLTARKEVRYIMIIFTNRSYLFILYSELFRLKSNRPRCGLFKKKVYFSGFNNNLKTND